MRGGKKKRSQRERLVENTLLNGVYNCNLMQ